MKKNILSKLVYIIYALLIISTVITLFIAYKKLDNTFAYNFLICYVIFLLLSFLYFIFRIVLNIRKLNGHETGKRLLKFIIWFVALSAFNYIFQFVLKYPSKGLLGDLAMPLGTSIGLTFFDLIFLAKDNKNR